MDKFTPTSLKISTDELCDKFKEVNKHKIPENVRVERVSENFADDHTGVMIHAYTLSLGARPQDWEVNLEDLEKAVSWKNRDWRYLLDPHNWGRGTVEEEEVTLQAVVNDHSPSLPVEEIINELDKIDQEWGGIAEEVLGRHSASGRSIKEMTTINNIFPNLPPHPPQDNLLHRLDSNNVNPHDQAGTGIDFNVNCMNLLHSSFSEKDIDDQQGIAQQHLSDPFLKDIQLLEHKPFEEVGSEAVQSVQRAEVLVNSLVNRIKCLNATIKELQATIERQNKEHEEFKLGVGKGAVRTEITPKANEKVEYLENKIKEIFQGMENLKKGTEQIKENQKKDKEEMKAELTQVKEINLREQRKGTHYDDHRTSASCTGQIDFFPEHSENPHNDENHIPDLELSLTSGVNVNKNRPREDDLELSLSSHGSRQSGHYKRTRLR
ncbi:hypothetical protein FEM48_Zijuj02G0049700 [Ziziphus jujuba var. spinosa]|uniref:Uncharacterized protein n=1 Tax=Ziziphus jujuba var. spinosa TaxID=714518 RepID=A0A978VTS0_ZIZJJ|nr:hypothetical protein FEM48_Zijuj02G0049700 [Ziziphus jujuba var. spinosa]